MDVPVRAGLTRARLAQLQATVEELLELSDVHADDILEAVADGLKVRKHENVGIEVQALALACARLRGLAERDSVGMVS
jgi:uncharacterized 2Fe-2S/4Fe-4S cluster protein (DUF4445 family)